MIKAKPKCDGQKIWSKVKVTGQGHRGQITIKWTVFKLLPHTNFDELWQDGMDR